MERIAPLAKILAEANGIDWQTLRGSGEGGMVVEQDILNYLSRIMSGEEEPPATPVDVPPDDWNGDMNGLPDLSGMSSEQLSRAGVDSDIAALLSQPRPQVSPEVPATATAPSLDAEDMEFELDDETDDAPVVEVAATPVVAATPAMGTWDWNARAPAAELAPVSIPAVPSPEPAAAVVPAPEAPLPQSPVVAAASGAAMASTAAASGLGSLLSRLYQQPPAETVAQDTAPAAPVEPNPQAQSAYPEPTPAAADHAAAGEPQGDHDRQAQPILADVPAVAPEAQQSAAGLPEPVLEEPLQSLTSPEPTSTEPISTEPTSSDAVHADQVGAFEFSAQEPGIDEPGTDEPTLVLPATGEGAISAPAAAADAVWFGTYLRRGVDFGALSALHGQLSSALEQEVPLAFLVARAAQRHAATLGLSSVALQGSAHNQARSVAGEHLRGAVAALAHSYEGTPDLLVVDAGALDLDDLHYPHTLTLSVGRVQDGQAALSLNGNVDAAQGARFLAELDATLNQPILLAL